MKFFVKQMQYFPLRETLKYKRQFCFIKYSKFNNSGHSFLCANYLSVIHNNYPIWSNFSEFLAIGFTALFFSTLSAVNNLDLNIYLLELLLAMHNNTSNQNTGINTSLSVSQNLT